LLLLPLLSPLCVAAVIVVNTAADATVTAALVPLSHCRGCYPRHRIAAGVVVFCSCHCRHCVAAGATVIVALLLVSPSQSPSRRCCCCCPHHRVATTATAAAGVAVASPLLGLLSPLRRDCWEQSSLPEPKPSESRPPHPQGPE